MQSPALPFQAPTLTNVGKQILILIGGVGLAALLCLQSDYMPLLLGFCCFVLLVGFSRFNISNLMISTILADHLCQFLKRIIFSITDQPPLEVYYGFQVMPTFILGISLLSSFVVIAHYKVPLSAKLAGVFVTITVLITTLSPRGGNLTGRLGGMNQQLIPFVALFIGMAVPVSAWKRIARLYTVLIIVSVTYGVFQFIHGYLPFEKTWAYATHDVSIEGRKVYDILIGESTDFRSFSYYSDHTMWGFFLVGAIMFLIACVPVGAISKKWLYLLFPLTCAGLLCSGVRTVWLALIAGLTIHRLLVIKGLRRPILMIAGVVASFAVVLTVGPYMLKNVHLAWTQNPLINRYITVGTIDARINAPEIFLRLLPSHILFGDGFGSSYNYRGLDSNLQFTSEAYSHNMLVDLLLYTGGPGLAAMLLFLYTWLREAFWVIERTTPPMASACRWLLACAVGEMMTGALQSSNFLNIYFFLIAGLVSGEWIRLKNPAARPALNR